MFQSLPQTDFLMGNSPHIRHLRSLIKKVAPSHLHVLITGESGTGKNIVAKEIHHSSRRKDRPFLVRNCGALEKNLMRSEFFGYARGAFTGAELSREGLLAVADRGTLFLDEVGELSPEVQGALLRVLENQTYRRVGEKQERRVDIRFIFATNRNLSEEINAGRFSDALFHRLNGFHISIAPLRERKEDIECMVRHFLATSCHKPGQCRVSDAAMTRLKAYSWPGNIRELQNVIERGIILSENGVITDQELPRPVAESCHQTLRDSRLPTLREMERQYIGQVLESVGGNQVRAAKILGINRKTLYRKLNLISFSGSPGSSNSIS